MDRKLIWAVYYDTGSEFDVITNLDMEPGDLPGGNVLAVVQVDDLTDYTILTGADILGQGFYWWDQGQWFIGDVWGLTQYVLEPGWQKILLGRTMPQGKWERFLAFMKKDWGEKFSRRREERK